MANYEENYEQSTKKPSIPSSTTAKPSLFNRSITMHSSAAPNPFSKKAYSSTIVDRNAASMKKWYNSFEYAGNSFKGKVRQLRTLFETPKPNSMNQSQQSLLSSSEDYSFYQSVQKQRPAKSLSTDYKDSWNVLDASTIRFPGTEDRVVVYFTSLRGIRRTREDCDAVRMIFRAFKVFVDERDVSMDAAYRRELQELVGEKNENVKLPQVFIKGKYVGGVDVIKQLNESGEIRKILQLLPPRDRRFVCDSCGDVRFLPCSNCSGSRKIFDDEEEVMKRCLECNENGLIRCPECCR